LITAVPVLMLSCGLLSFAGLRLLLMRRLPLFALGLPVLLILLPVHFLLSLIFLTHRLLLFQVRLLPITLLQQRLLILLIRRLPLLALGLLPLLILLPSLILFLRRSPLLKVPLSAPADSPGLSRSAGDSSAAPPCVPNSDVL
jgi:hypothetical protein